MSLHCIHFVNFRCLFVCWNKKTILHLLCWLALGGFPSKIEAYGRGKTRFSLPSICHFLNKVVHFWNYCTPVSNKIQPIPLG